MEYHTTTTEVAEIARDADVKKLPIPRNHLVASAHCSPLSVQGAGAMISKTLSGRDHGLLANHAITNDFFDISFRIFDNPMAT